MVKISRQLAPAVSLLLALSGTSSVASASQAPESPETFLSFESKIDGRCHNLSEGGKLAVMHNNHATEKIRYRLIRYYIDVRQRGRATGVAAPGEVVKLGCTLVGGRPQRWVIERAEFTTEDT